MLSEIDKCIIKELQVDIQICSRPYEFIAEKLCISEEEVISRIQELIERGIIRRFGAILNHRRVGISANAMVVWEIPDERVQDVGNIMSSFIEVTHCYQRPTFLGWSYNMFTMVHANTRKDCEEIVDSISKEININKYEILYSIEELKKTSMIYLGTEKK